MEMAFAAVTATIIVPTTLVIAAKKRNSGGTEGELYTAYKAYIDRNKTETADSE